MRKWMMRVLPYLGVAAVLVIISALLDGLITLKTKVLIDVVLQKNRELFVENAGYVLALTAAAFPVNIFLAYSKGVYKRKTLVRGKEYFLRALFYKRINQFQKEKTSKYLSAVTNDMNMIEENYIGGVYEGIELLVRFTVTVIIISTVSLWVMIAGVAISVISVLVSKVLNKALQKHQRDRSELYEGYTSYTKEVLSAFRIIKENNLHEKARKDFEDRSKLVGEKGYIVDKILSRVSIGYELIFQITFLTIIIFMGLMAFKTQISIGGVFVVIMNIQNITGPIMRLGEIIPKIGSTEVVFSGIDEMLKNEEEYEERILYKKLRDKIELKDVCFSYDEEVLMDANLLIKKGEKYLIAGPSGGGKSTLLKLLGKYIYPYSGEILVDGTNLRDIKCRSYFENISNIQQEVFLFEDTLRNNLKVYGEYSEEQLNSAICNAGLKNFVMAMEDGLDTIIYDNGKNISGGEKRRIAIARALLRGAEILLVDEAFAGLDWETAKKIEKTILNLDGITVLNVSHVVFEENKSFYDGMVLVEDKMVIQSRHNVS